MVSEQQGRGSCASLSDVYLKLRESEILAYLQKREYKPELDFGHFFWLQTLD